MGLRFTPALAALALLASAGLAASQTAGREAPPVSEAPSVSPVVEEQLIDDLRQIAREQIVLLAIASQNNHYGHLQEAEILKLDEQWKRERESSVKPLIAMTLSNPLSTFLTRLQAGSEGLFRKIWATDQNGLNVGQTLPTNDFWQGDEEEFTLAFNRGPGGVQVFGPKWNAEFLYWYTTVTLTVADGSNTAIGAMTFVVNLEEFTRRAALGII
ncbi:hypothetical protein FDP22_21185 (plasmid) [Paroceanicella profunda]|uniref:Uncharacterized protein n=1 Tax=Paroceanicella profunda TaxID=2579971 RepID=A0A5B8G4L6_9RHOB|nr:hypothetical protein [Paroceanicella profunda]QDL94389.1 hypothetical protein FDP22_21185 [Paroceanicella profunda]